ncbi:MAG: hypothetical protein ACHQNV_01390 [Vicinamibacteria bacterium]
MKKVCILNLAAGVLLGAAGAANYEPNPVFKASEILPKGLLSGPNFKVEENVPSDGYVLHFTITSDVGGYEAEGREMLEVRVQEILALAKLNEVSQTDAFAKAVGQSAKNTGAAVVNVATKPVETAKGVPEGVGRFFKGVGKSAKQAGQSVGDAASGDDDAKSTGEMAEGATKAVTGANKAKRGWAKQAQVDPYSSNAALQKKLDELANASSAGGFAMKIVNPIPIAGMVASVNGLAWDLPAEDIAALNDKKLTALGVAEPTRKAFFKNPFYTPSQALGLVAALDALAGVSGADAAVTLATRKTKSEADARFYRRAAEILARYQKTMGPIAHLVMRPTLFLGQTKSGALIVPVPYDWIGWTAEVDAVSANRELKGSPREIWLFGKASKEALKELTARHWVVRENVLGS